MEDNSEFINLIISNIFVSSAIPNRPGSKTVRWASEKIPFCGVPFLMMGSLRYYCHQGKRLQKPKPDVRWDVSIYTQTTSACRAAYMNNLSISTMPSQAAAKTAARKLDA